VLVGVHVHALAAKADTFHFEAHVLFQGGFAMKFDGAAGSQHALPGERSHGRSAQQLRHLAVIERVAGGGGDLSVRGDFAAGDLADGFAESGLGVSDPVQLKIDVAQDYAEGRVTFIDLAARTSRTITGFELGASIVEWSASDGGQP